MPKRYWLFKSEPSCYSIDNLALEKGKRTSWDGVRNFQARNILRDDIKKGDEVFFYNSNSKPLGIAGICEVVKEGYPDHTALDSENQHFDPKSTKENPKWYMVDVKFSKKFKEIVTLPQLKETHGLEKMTLTQRGSRLSIQPVTSKEWQIIMKIAR